MSTHCYIGSLQADGGVRYVYNHANGHPAHLGAILLQHYTRTTKIDSLLDLGDLSNLGPRLGRKTNFDRPAKGQCITYVRDRGEPPETNSAKLCPDKERYFAAICRDQVTYAYLWTGTAWEVASRHDWTLEFDQPDPRPDLDLDMNPGPDTEQHLSRGPWQPLHTILMLTKGETPPRPTPENQLRLPLDKPQLRLL